VSSNSSSTKKYDRWHLFLSVTFDHCLVREEQRNNAMSRALSFVSLRKIWIGIQTNMILRATVKSYKLMKLLFIVASFNMITFIFPSLTCLNFLLFFTPQACLIIFITLDTDRVWSPNKGQTESFFISNNNLTTTVNFLSYHTAR
jgi:hypothetical protein